MITKERLKELIEKYAHDDGTPEDVLIAELARELAAARSEPAPRIGPSPFKVEKLHVVISIGKDKWEYHRRKDGSVTVGQVGNHGFDHDKDVTGESALSAVIKELNKGIAEAKRQVLTGEAPEGSNGSTMMRAAGISLGMKSLGPGAKR